MRSPRLPVVVLISGHGSNLQVLIDRMQAHRLPVDIRAVISNRRDAFGLERARRADIHAECIRPSEFDDRERYEAALATAIDRYQPGLVILAGFMRILGADIVRRYRGRMFNIHPSLLPKYRGLDTHRRALDAGDVQHGASVHFVTEELDGGPVVIQAEVPILEDDDEQSLAARVQEAEHVIYPEAIRLFASGQLAFENGMATFKGMPLTRPLTPAIANRN